MAYICLGVFWGGDWASAAPGTIMSSITSEIYRRCQQQSERKICWRYVEDLITRHTYAMHLYRSKIHVLVFLTCAYNTSQCWLYNNFLMFYGVRHWITSYEIFNAIINLKCIFGHTILQKELMNNTWMLGKLLDQIWRISTTDINISAFRIA